MIQDEKLLFNSDRRSDPPSSSYLVVEEAYLEDVLQVLHPVGHGQVPQGVSEQQHVGPGHHLLEVLRVEQGSLPLVVDVDQLPLEGPQHALRRTRQVGFSALSPRLRTAAHARHFSSTLMFNKV